MSDQTLWNIGGIEFILTRERVLWIPSLKVLVISDVHLGKATHFRKGGIQVPLETERDNFDRLGDVILNYPCTQVVFLGDLFHSDYNQVWEVFASFLKTFKSIEFLLIPGNHDVLNPNEYKRAGLVLTETNYVRDNILFTHAPLEKERNELVICGHIHPAVRLKGKGKVSMKFPCFWLSNKQLVMPAFGAFTGSKIVKPKKGDRVAVLTEMGIHEVD